MAQTSASQKKTSPKKKKTAGKKKALPVSPLAPTEFPEMPEVSGLEIATASTGERYKGRKDLLVAHMPAGTTVAGAFTQSSTASGAVEWCRSNVLSGSPRARVLVVNAGNANAFTGRRGSEAIKAIADGVNDIHGYPKSQIFMSSTGVIGEPLKAAKIVAKLDAKPAKASQARWRDAAEAIRTTDTFAKGCARVAKIEDSEVRIGGIAKGSGMIAPDLATMLAFVFTDAKLPSSVLQALLAVGIRDSFNQITVDSDTSTSDTVLLFATGKCAPHAEITRAGDPRLKDFREKLQEVLEDLAKQIVRDGEGATKFITVRVSGASTARSAKAIALSIANSPLVKTAVAGEDANWGRIVMAVGKAGEPAERDKLQISFGPHLLAEKGQRVAGYDEALVSAYMKNPEIEICVDLGIGSQSAEIWTCDLTHGYISINADYRS
ncbi:MAG: bifunctional glutamate N-acetyltransferase/amino-acid acetyltransferase ArgJ [Alphaproteobacteria bacterium]|nr:MAG: bifunctional glutamate N-acetyltransferase/amino-acid acetyltransferase ArgJ [Alphaproteobacteria bacterium]